MELIDKSSVLAEIEKLQDSTMDENSNFCTAEAQAEYDILCVLEDSINNIEVEHDAFIEKACEWLKSHYRDYMYNPTGERLEAFFGGDMCNDFENYMMEK
jgi:hypothetical protein